MKLFKVKVDLEKEIEVIANSYDQVYAYCKNSGYFDVILISERTDIIEANKIPKTKKVIFKCESRKTGSETWISFERTNASDDPKKPTDRELLMLKDRGLKFVNIWK